MGLVTFIIFAVILYVLVSIRILKQYERGVVFMLGRFAGVRGPGLTLIFAAGPADDAHITAHRDHADPVAEDHHRDNVSIDIAAVAYYHITDPERSVIAIENVYNAISQISQTTVRNVVGRFSLDQLLATPRALTSRSRT